MKLSKLELEVMQYFWNVDETSANDVHRLIETNLCNQLLSNQNHCRRA